MHSTRAGKVDWAVIAALAASLAALVAVGTAAMVFWHARQDTQRILLSTALDAVWRLDAQWNSLDMADIRSSAAAGLLDGRPNRDLDAVLAFFDEIGLLVGRGAVDEELVWHQFYWPMANYWSAGQDYIHQVERDDPMRWQQLGVLMPRLVSIEARHRKRAVDEVMPTAAQVREFLTDEAENDECEEGGDAGTRKTPL